MSEPEKSKNKSETSWPTVIMFTVFMLTVVVVVYIIVGAFK